MRQPQYNIAEVELVQACANRCQPFSKLTVNAVVPRGNAFVRTSLGKSLAQLSVMKHRGPLRYYERWKLRNRSTAVSMLVAR